ncbi:PQQ-binding-like beta-propeller repeat protein [Vannielia litorea]|uniref:Outer membrane protein assembly factor BamB, contains PQQ-like beta-propeller repeat n=1 Tax=Vannielia litorea TaxID=1217970 RepID=A0A1N6EQF1_9RHOB|nr:PQQ-binding-like beta-propeller repeat protein [Vannielia litorea]SIN85312.1 Outer membrane protein assembly factor BamB, contains PQQ-like beta-propeller repeat [Vannielia litorea]
MRAATQWITAGAILALLTGCGGGEQPLPGKRIGIREAAGVSDLGGETAPVYRGSAPISLPAPVNHGEWTHRNGTAQHRIQHPALARNLQAVWRADIGAGNSRKARITADPVASGGRIFAMDSRAQVTALSSGGAVIWSTDITPARDRTKDASGGGLAVQGNTLYVASGYGELLALDTATGGLRWRQQFEAPVQGTPTVEGGTVYVVSRDSRAFAVDAANGRLKWEMPGTPTPSVMVGGAGPAVTARSVIFPMGANTVTAALKLSGVRTWGEIIAGERRGRVYTNYSDITGDPVVAGNTVYVGTQAGRTVALNADSGERLWTAQDGAYSPVWPAGNSVFLVSDASQLVRLNAATGETIWSVKLPDFTKQKVRRRKAVFAHYGPVLAGGLLRVASDDGLLRSFDPVSGAMVAAVELPGGAASNPIVVAGTLYVVNGKGQLVAFR